MSKKYIEDVIFNASENLRTSYRQLAEKMSDCSEKLLENSRIALDYVTREKVLSKATDISHLIRILLDDQQRVDLLNRICSETRDDDSTYQEVDFYLAEILPDYFADDCLIPGVRMPDEKEATEYLQEIDGEDAPCEVWNVKSLDLEYVFETFMICGMETLPVFGTEKTIEDHLGFRFVFGDGTACVYAPCQIIDLEEAYEDVRNFAEYYNLMCDKGREITSISLIMT